MDAARLYDVAEGGAAWTEAPDPARLRRIRSLYGIGILMNAATWSLAGLALLLGGRLWGAGFGLLAMLSTPLLVLPIVAASIMRLHGRRRHRHRPDEFG